MPSLSPRSYANNRNLAAKPTKASNTDQVGGLVPGKSDGKVQIEVKVLNGRITEADVLPGAPMLASSAKAWIVGNWKFKPEVSGVFTIPINYKRQA